MLTPSDIKIEKVEYQNGDVEFHVKTRVFKRVKTGLFSSKIVPTNDFQVYQDYNGYSDSIDYPGKCSREGEATLLRERLLKEYYHSLPATITEIK